MQRTDKRKNDQLRDVSITPDFNMHAEGSALIKFGNTHVVCNATIEKATPRWMQNDKRGWITAEYGMLPRSTNERMNRESVRGKQGGRTMEIQRLIGRALRQSVNMKYLADKTITIDCDVIQADGGTRTAAITGGCVALFYAIKNTLKDHRAIKKYVAAVSAGIINGTPMLDLDYNEDSNAESDLNFVMDEEYKIIEIQGTAEEQPFTEEELNEMLNLAKEGIKKIISIQKECLS